MGNLHEDSKGKIVKDKVYFDIGDSGYKIANAGADIESIMASGGLTFTYEPTEETPNPLYTHLIFSNSADSVEYGTEYIFLAYSAETLVEKPFRVDGNDLTEIIVED